MEYTLTLNADEGVYELNGKAVSLRIDLDGVKATVFADYPLCFEFEVEGVKYLIENTFDTDEVYEINRALNPEEINGVKFERVESLTLTYDHPITKFLFVDNLPLTGGER